MGSVDDFKSINKRVLTLFSGLFQPECIFPVDAATLLLL